MGIGIKRLSLVVIALFFVVAATTMNPLVFAQENAEPAGGSGLRISPTRTELTIIAGDSRDVVQTVKNVTQTPIIVQPSLNDFESDNLTGQPRLIGDPNDVSANSLRQFISLPEEFRLEPDEEREVTVGLNVPENAGPGAYFGSVLYRASPPGADGGGQVALVASVGSLVLLEVPGDIVEQIEVEDVSAYLREDSGWLFTQKPDSVGILINNLGNSFARPFGKVSVTDWRGNEIFGYELNDLDRRSNILPDSSRLFSQELFNVEEKTVNGVVQQEKTSPITWPGKYTITGNISHGSTGEVFTVSATFWYLPMWLLITLLVLLVGLIGGAWYLYRKYITKSTKRRK